MSHSKPAILSRLYSNLVPAMSSSKTLLLPDVFAQDDIKIGQFLANPLQPISKKKSPSDKILGNGSLIKIGKTGSTPFPFHRALETGEGFVATLVNIIIFGLSGQREGYIHNHAESMKERHLNDVSKALAEAVSDENVQKWIKSFAFPTSQSTLSPA